MSPIRIRIAVALAVYWLALFATTHLPIERLPEPVADSDKLIHFTAFAGLAALLWLFLRARPGGATVRTAALAAAVLVPYAILDEYTQQLVGRHTDVLDGIADVAGITCALLVCELVRRRVRR